MKIEPHIEESWKLALNEQFNSSNFLSLKHFLIKDKQSNIIFPEGKYIFNAFNLTPFNEVKVVIIGQDPYHSFEMLNNKKLPHAHGLCFSVPSEAKKIPPSLKNIFKELNTDIGIKIPTHGNLTSWAKQGVLLLNATLTVREHLAGSHQKKGWEAFTDFAIQQLSEQKKDLVFLLWGNFAQKKGSIINSNKHFILKAAHPSPFSAYNGFFGCKHFSKTNQFLKSKKLKEIEWNLE